MMTNMTISALHLVAAAEGGGRRKEKTDGGWKEGCLSGDNSTGP